MSKTLETHTRHSRHTLDRPLRHATHTRDVVTQTFDPVLQCVAVCAHTQICVAVCCRVCTHTDMCCSVLQCVHKHRYSTLCRVCLETLATRDTHAPHRHGRIICRILRAECNCVLLHPCLHTDMDIVYYALPTATSIHLITGLSCRILSLS